MKEWNAGTLLSVSSAYWRGCALQAAVRLRIFTMLASASMTASELATKIASDPEGTALLLDAITAMGLLRKEDDSYANTSTARTLLAADSPAYLGHIILHHHHILDGWAQLDAVVRTGQPVQRRSYGEAVERESFLLGMFNLAMGLAPILAKKIDLAGRRRLLDLGGGPGTYAIHFCLANPELKAVIFDRPSTEPFARRTTAQFGVAERIDFVAGDFTRDPLDGGPYDVAWLSHVLHSNTVEACERLIANTLAAMVPGGLIMIHDFILDDRKDGPEFPALFSLNMLIAGNGGRSYAVGEITAMLAKAGVKDIHHHPFRAPNDSSILIGTVG